MWLYPSMCVWTFKLAPRVTWHSAPAGTYGPIYTRRLTQHHCLERRDENARKKTTKGISPNHYPLRAEKCAETSAMLISLLHTQQHTHRSITHGELTFTHTHIPHRIQANTYTVYSAGYTLAHANICPIWMHTQTYTHRPTHGTKLAFSYTCQWQMNWENVPLINTFPGHEYVFCFISLKYKYILLFLWQQNCLAVFQCTLATNRGSLCLSMDPNYINTHPDY